MEILVYVVFVYYMYNIVLLHICRQRDPCQICGKCTFIDYIEAQKADTSPNLDGGLYICSTAQWIRVGLCCHSAISVALLIFILRLEEFLLNLVPELTVLFSMCSISMNYVVGGFLKFYLRCISCRILGPVWYVPSIWIPEIYIYANKEFFGRQKGD